MDCIKVGRLIHSLRTEKSMTQKQLAQLMNISDKTVSKWERGLGCPDVSLLAELSVILGTNIEKILSGTLDEKETDGGNMNKIKFYICPGCKNIITATSDAEISCCSRKLTASDAKQADEKHKLNIDTIEDDFYITFDHEMKKDHYLNFFAYVSYDKMLLVKLYPEQGSEIRFPKLYGGKLYYGCSEHGLFVQDCKDI
ncbi:MAG: helix-turn-helix domain-containing protein [Oscillospiraceae bacterium]|nr:helix-turn-helix domain-containing protein [Oscillospiraceae bacterium]